MTRRGVQSLWPEAEKCVEWLSLEKRLVYETARRKALLDSVKRSGPTIFTEDEIRVLDEVARGAVVISKKEILP